MIMIYLSYLFALLLCFFAVFIFFRKKKKSMLSFLIGFFSFVLYFVLLMALFHFTFKTPAYYNTPVFRVLIGIVFVFIVTLLRFWILKIAYFDRSNENQAESFFAGFGAAPAAGLGVYVFVMLLLITAHALFNGPAIVEQSGVLSFRDNTVISVFLPVTGHISFAFTFLFYRYLLASSGTIERKLLTGKHPIRVAVLWTVFSCVLESVCVVCIPFMKLLSIRHWHLALIVGFCAGLNYLLARFYPSANEKTSNYEKQFE